MGQGSSGDVTLLLQKWGGGDREALDALLRAIQAKLRGMAAGQLRHERTDHTLQPTALVNEAYLRIVDQRQVNWRDRAHVLEIAPATVKRDWSVARAWLYRELREG